MARPKTIKLPEGEVILKNIPKEMADKISEFLNQGFVVGENKSEEGYELDIMIPTESPRVIETADVKPCEDTALALKRNSDGSWLLVDVKFNPDTKEAYVEKVKNYGPEKAIAVGDFKVKVSKLFLT